jgi:hypothetical protein
MVHMDYIVALFHDPAQVDQATAALRHLGLSDDERCEDARGIHGQ